METSQKLLRIAGIGLAAGAMIFAGLSLFGYRNTWTLPAALGCSSLSLLFQIIMFRQKGE